jgi:hypothetical protein
MAASIITLLTLLYLSVGILLLCRKHLHGASIITLFTLLYLSFGILLLCRKHLHGRFYNNTVHAVRYNSVNSVIIEAAMQVLST